MTAPLMGFVAPAAGPGPLPPPPPVSPPLHPAHTHPDLSPLELEGAARAALNGWLNLSTTVNAPTWRQILFSGSQADITLPKIPAGALDDVDRIPEVLPGDGPAKEAASILDALRTSRPRGGAPRSISARKELPPPRDAMASWLRRLFLLCAGPNAARLLASAGYLTTGDVKILDGFYPLGLDAERQAAVEAAIAFTAAASRGNHREADLPERLNAQLITLMGDQQPADFFQGLYDASSDGQQGTAGGTAPAGPGLGAPPNALVKNSATSTQGTDQ